MTLAINNTSKIYNFIHMNNIIPFVLFTFFLLYSCSSYKSNEVVDVNYRYEVVDVKCSESNNCIFTVYSPDTNWSSMIEFAKKQIDGKGISSAVGFFYPRDRVPLIEEDFSIKPEYYNNMIANYFVRTGSDYQLSITEHHLDLFDETK